MSLQSRHLLDDGVSFTISRVQKNRNVKKAELLYRDFYYALMEIKRISFLPDLFAYIADVYILTADDVQEILSIYPNVNCIVVISNWDNYTDMAKELAKESNVGVFSINEFKVALGLYGKRFLDTGNPTKTE